MRIGYLPNFAIKFFLKFLFDWILSDDIAKDTTDSRVEFISQIHSSQFTNLDQNTISESQLSINFKISTTNISILTKSKVKILTKTSFRILTKIQLCNLNLTSSANNDQTTASKSRLNFNFKILTQVLKV